MLILENISKHFISENERFDALNDITFTIKEGEIFGIVGKSGVGKSTLLKILSLELKPDNGNFFLFKTNTKDLTKKEVRALIKKTAFIYQEFSLLYNLTVLENIELPLKINKVPKRERQARALQMLEFIGLTELKDKYPITISGGEAQRIGIARALITNPKILYLDEPTSALDDKSALDILNLIKRIHERFKPTIVLVSHQIDVIKYLCEKVLLLEDGKVKSLRTIKNSNDIIKSYETRLWGEES